jgi:hypothetical protein
VAIEYRLRCDLSSENARVGETLFSECNLLETGRGEIVLGRVPGTEKQDRGEMVTFVGKGVVCYFHPESILGQSIIEDAYGFRPTHNLTFRIDKFDNYDCGISNMMRACANIIKLLSRDCVLFDGDVPLLLRRDHRLVLQSSDSFWVDKLRTIATDVGDEYAFAEIPVP